MGAPMNLERGVRATWHREQRGGYGFVVPVPVVVVKQGAVRWQVLAPLAHGTAKLIWVKAEKLFPREYGHFVDAEFAKFDASGVPLAAPQQQEPSPVSHTPGPAIPPRGLRVSR